jgi:hypothetical protein
MSDPRLTAKAQREMEEVWNLRREALRLLRLVIAEWESDPVSTQCFDSRIVTRAKEVSERLRKLDLFDEI